jgi:hypothetical protein
MRYLVVFCLSILLSISLVRAQDVQGDVYVEARVDNPNPYVGQQIIYSFKLYDAVEVANPLYEPSDFEGFWRTDLGVVSQTAEQINGRRYRVTTISTALYPTHAGTITIQPSSVVLAETVFRSKQTLTANPVSIDVKALPTSNSPNFNGAVGQFTMSAAIDRKAVKVGEPLLVTVTISGTGNVEQLPPPTIPDNWRVTINTGDFSSKIHNGLIVGTRDYQIVFIPVTAGIQELPPITLDYFDPVGVNYQSLSTSPIQIQVSSDAVTLPNTALSSTEPSLKLKPIGDLSGTDTNPFLIIVAILFPLIAVIVIWYQQRLKIRTAQLQIGMRRQQALQVASRGLQSMILDDSKANYQLIDNIFMGYIADKLNTDLEKVKQADLWQLLPLTRTPEGVISKVKTFMSEVDEGLFSLSAEGITKQRCDVLIERLRDIDAEWVVR